MEILIFLLRTVRNDEILRDYVSTYFSTINALLTPLHAPMTRISIVTFKPTQVVPHATGDTATGDLSAHLY